MPTRRSRRSISNQGFQFSLCPDDMLVSWTSKPMNKSSLPRTGLRQAALRRHEVTLQMRQPARSASGFAACDLDDRRPIRRARQTAASSYKPAVPNGLRVPCRRLSAWRKDRRRYERSHLGGGRTRRAGHSDTMIRSALMNDDRRRPRRARRRDSEWKNASLGEDRFLVSAWIQQKFSMRN